MEKKINKLEHCHVEVIISADAADWKKAQDKAFDKEASKVEIKGFRKGKAPKNLVKDRVNMAAVLNGAVDIILPDLYRHILEEDDIRPFTQPKVDVTKISEDELEVKFIIVTDEDLQKEIDALLERNALLVVKEDASADGDTVVMDFVGKIDGVPFEGGSAENYELVLGSKSFIPGFEDQLIGHKAGEDVLVNVTFPEQYTEELKNKPATFKCHIHEVKTKKLPTLDDEFVKEQKIEGVETVDALKAHLSNKKLQEKKNQARNDYMGKLLEEIAKNSKFDIPEEVLEQQVNYRKDDFEKRMKQSNLSLEQYLQITGQTEEQFLAQLKENSLKELSNYLILENVAEKEGLADVSDEELEFEFSRLAEQYKMSIDDVKKALNAQLDQFKNNIKMTRVENFLYDNND